MTDPKFPVIDPPFGTSVDPTVSAVVLAAGTSSRFGPANKLLTAIDGTPLICHAVSPFVELLEEVIVVVGHDAPAVQEAVDHLPVTCVENPAYADGQATSVRRGLSAISADVEGVLFGLGDMPGVRPSTVSRLCNAFAASAGDPVIAAFERQRGNPVLFGQQHFGEIQTITGDVGARSVLLAAEEPVLVETGDPGVLRDVDTQSDL